MASGPGGPELLHAAKHGGKPGAPVSVIFLSQEVTLINDFNLAAKTLELILAENILIINRQISPLHNLLPSFSKASGF